MPTWIAINYPVWVDATKMWQNYYQKWSLVYELGNSTCA